MPKLRFQTISVTAVAVSFITALSCAGVACEPMRSRLFAVCMGAAVAGTPTAALLWAVRWLRGGGMGYVLDALLNQRDWYRRRLRMTGPLHHRHVARHAR